MSEEHALTLDKMEVKVGDMNLRKEIYTVPVDDTTALDALKMMRDKVLRFLGIDVLKQTKFLSESNRAWGGQ